MSSSYQPLRDPLEDRDSSKEDIQKPFEGDKADEESRRGNKLADEEDKTEEDVNDSPFGKTQRTKKDEESGQRLLSVQRLLTKLVWSDADIEAAFTNINDSFTDPDAFAIDAVAYPWLGAMQLANSIMLANQMGMLVLVRLFASCSDSGQATYPVWIWSAAMPFMIVRLLIEGRAARSFVPAYARFALRIEGLALFKLGPFDLDSLSWFVISMGFSTSNIFDMATDSCFTGVTWVSLRCPGEQASSIWEETFAQSLFGKLGAPVIDLGWVAMLFWCMSLFQVVAPLAQHLGMKKDESDPTSEVKSCFCNLGFAGDVCEKLADGAGMATIQTLLSSKTQAGIKMGGSLQAVLDDVVLPYASVVAFRVWLSHVLEIALQINLQVTLFAINSYIVSKAWTNAQMQAVVSIALSLVTASTKLAEIYTFLKIVNVKQITSGLKEEAEGSDNSESLLRLSRYVWLVRIGFAIVVLSVIYGVIKFGAVFFCDDSMWNITGCAAMSHEPNKH